uniref:Putative Acyl carrier protein n=1 Tax=Magnetococcus massalia (strain MO-1) TaxID=451514 RepID=A0A1S7LDF1_MAGMO|nr:putative Acyl carrier protein [Candidatus Magnetococcus massalia]
MSDARLDQVRTAFNTAFGTAPEAVTNDSTPDDIEGWDSLGHVRLASELEGIFDLSFDVDDLMKMEDVAAILDVLQTKLGAA